MLFYIILILIKWDIDYWYYFILGMWISFLWFDLDFKFLGLGEEFEDYLGKESV